MEIEIDSKKNNSLLNRTEVYFTVKHPGEKTPNREIIRSELADKLNVKKEHVIVDYIDTQFGVQVLSGYAKIYSSTEQTKQLEPNYLLKRNKIIEGKSKDKKGEKKSEAPAEKPVEEKKEPIKEEPKKEVQVEKKETQKLTPEQHSKAKPDELKSQKDSKPKEESKKEQIKPIDKKE